MDGMDLDEWDRDPYPPFPEVLPTEAPLNIPAMAPSSTQASNLAFSATPSTSEVITVDGSNSTRHLHAGIIIGRAKSHCCRDPNVRPTARAILNSKGSVCAYIPHQYAKRSVSTGEVQIAMKDVEFCKEFEDAASDEQRIMAIRLKLEAKSGARQQLHEGTVSKSPSPGSVAKKRKRV
ncbi:hypothetical protein HBI56_140970 [Parastagonospora nodorum]|uniref:Uncharacterized protein n=1 Tax=Phaeosphaeria nodorum (strain SN15 / ATCC MYA-4574 / FGSC 10173) TaxID=321614 RepID=A0A7U2I9L1_PHANO|nr:hypothetical protein HBH56_126860 [Parastagonospora nodorum]QRD05793.1 hypothetical protein JI435_304300 [Parastagonospora nodorum SN15]KAH3931285.1 hypothetical protein HBH54_096640 [Parastagonospora nodorum]KAH3947247.1 hypothetical protein HBH53_117120 [Parastagonospora nodorum]KAH3970788.1 hypothetical protein HBH51_113570 [Parastagonospora nodorum]